MHLFENAVKFDMKVSLDKAGVIELGFVELRAVEGSAVETGSETAV